MTTLFIKTLLVTTTLALGACSVVPKVDTSVGMGNSPVSNVELKTVKKIEIKDRTLIDEPCHELEVITEALPLSIIEAHKTNTLKYRSCASKVSKLQAIVKELLK